ncbi:MAG: alkaline phosphatase family protein [Planctomycetes bacterium]|nr:alkaline phosphatase family protein [Planctomycetota bacterium]
MESTARTGFNPALRTTFASPAPASPASAVAAHPRRETTPLAQRVLVVGLDGATFDILNPLMAQGRMPNLQRLIETGTSGILDSTKPPITPAAWTTFMTGKGPGRHGIVDFEKYDVRTNQLSFNSTYEIREKTIWEVLSDKGFHVGSINVPMTYPPRKVNGFMISGFETPSVDTEFTWPPELKPDILRRWPDYNYRSDWQRKLFGGDDLFQRNVHHIERSFAQGYELATFCGQRYGWDVLMVLFKLVDNIQHKAWKYLDPKTSHRYPRRAAIAAHCFEELDKTIGDLARYAAEQEALLIIMSDHGHGSLDGKAQPNALLEEWGYLRLRSRLGQARRRAERTVARMLGRTPKRFDANIGIEHEIDIDWPSTRACIVHAGMYGFLYLSLKGRQPGGIIEPVDYERVRDDLRDRFLQVTARNPDGELIQVFPEVHKAEELYDCSRDDQPWLPDLLLVPHPGLAVVRRIRGSAPVRWSSRRRMEGTHRVEGILIANGPNVKPGGMIHAQIADIAPTLLAAIGLRVPADMEGRVLQDLFSAKLGVEYEPPQKVQVAEHAEVYSEEEKAALTRRLSDLGYLE